MNLDFLLDRNNIAKFWNKNVVIFRNQEILSYSLPSATDLINCFKVNFISGKWSDPVNVNINASCINPDGTHQQFLSIDLDAAKNLFLNGFSLCFGDLSSSIDHIASLKAQAVKIFEYSDLIAVTGYLSPPGAVGVLHYDRQHNFFIQREGIKRWYVSEKPAIKNPYENLVYAGLSKSFIEDMKARGYEILLPRDCGKQLFELKPGDVLYVPPGFYHSPETLDEPSLHYTLTLEPACFWKDFNKDMFARLLSSNENFFEDYRFLSEAQRTELINDCFDSVMKKLMPQQ